MQRMCQGYDSGNNGEIVWIDIHIADESTINFQDIDRQFGDITERRITSTEIVYRKLDTHILDEVELLNIGFDIVHDYTFRDLKLERGSISRIADHICHHIDKILLP